MFITEIDEEHANEKRTNALKPMNCPCHVQVFNQGLRSYKDLPIRFSEFGSCHRYEASGTLHGLMRVRGFTQDDGHIFCTEDQIQDETKSFIELLSDIYAQLGFEAFEIKLSTRPEVRAGTDEIWDKAELALENAIKNLKLPYEVVEGDGAFYGPKLDFVLIDALGREWQLGTIQVDYNLPERFKLEYVGSDNAKHRPVMIHRAPFGSMERFIAVLLEHCAGNFPLWLTSEQVKLIPISEKVNDYANEVLKVLKNSDIRGSVDERNETAGKKIRDAETAKVPYMLVLGEKEAQAGTVSVRKHGGEDMGVMQATEFVELLNKVIEQEMGTVEVS